MILHFNSHCYFLLFKFFKYKIYFHVYGGGGLCLHFVCVPYVVSAAGRWKKVTSPLELGLQTIVDCNAGAENQAQVSLRSALSC